MNTGGRRLFGILIFADESAEWRCAGLSQLERLVLALNEYLGRAPGTGQIPICVHWIGVEPKTLTSLSQDKRLTRVLLGANADEFFTGSGRDETVVLVVSTRLVLGREAATSTLENLMNGAGPVFVISGMTFGSEASLGSLRQLFQRLREVELEASQQMPEKKGVHDWFYLNNEQDIGACEKRLLRSTGKSQDGFVSRFVNRPISRALSRLLVRFPVLPNQWTLILTAIPIAGSILLMQGNYFGFACGAIMFQLHSALDGCDGEIARVKYLESAAGNKLDALCDRFTTLLYAVSIGIGLSRQPGVSEAMRWAYAMEGVIAALFIGVSESLLTRQSISSSSQLGAAKDNLYSDYLKGHGRKFNQGDQLKLWMIKNTGALRLGEGVASFFSEATKRDVFNFGFMLLALCGLPHLILHILAVCAGLILLVAFKNLLTPAFDPGRARRPPPGAT